MKLDRDSLATLRDRKRVGTECIGLAAGPSHTPWWMSQEDRETYAKDAISHILTALFGPAGQHRQQPGNRFVADPNAFAINEARRITEQAFDSYLGDAEDYTAEEDA